MFKRALLLAATLLFGAVGVIVLQVTETAPQTASAARWQPGPHEPWQWMISGTLNVNSTAHMKGGGSDQPTTYDIDGFENSAATVAALHAKGYHVICYIEVGSWVDYRPDSKLFPKSIIGKGIDGFSDKWTDIRSPLLKPLIAARIAMCASKGFDAVEPDLEDGYSNNTGFPLTAADQIAFNTWVANTVHAAGMSVLLKGDPEQAKQLAPTVDFFLNEECNDYNECSMYPALAASGKTVLNAEYSGRCPTSSFTMANLNTTLFKLDLDGSRQACANSKGPAGTPGPTPPTTPTTEATTTTLDTTTTQPTKEPPSPPCGG
jgi:hypothetical protein